MGFGCQNEILASAKSPPRIEIDTPLVRSNLQPVAETDPVLKTNTAPQSELVEWSAGQHRHDRIAACDADRNFPTKLEFTLDRNPYIAAVPVVSLG